MEAQGITPANSHVCLVPRLPSPALSAVAPVSIEVDEGVLVGNPLDQHLEVEQAAVDDGQSWEGDKQQQQQEEEKRRGSPVTVRILERESAKSPPQPGSGPGTGEQFNAICMPWQVPLFPKQCSNRNTAGLQNLHLAGFCNISHPLVIRRIAGRLSPSISPSLEHPLLPVGTPLGAPLPTHPHLAGGKGLLAAPVDGCLSS